MRRKSRLRPTRCRSRVRTVGARCPEATIPSATNAFCSVRDPRIGSRDSPAYSPCSGGKADEQADSKIVYREDVVYGRVHGAGLLADIAYPESKEPLPAIISVHGGR